mmetsp:Transcript_46146/g.144536  ORF Transcript_46146/g.144536 Transcript_46146/m.144536 type:complete len:244 (-) Transcript_46146:311-1042(-)
MGEAQWQAGCDVGRPGHAAQRDHSHTGRHPAHLLGGWGELHKHNGLRGAAALPRRLRDLVRAAAAPVRRAPGPQDAAGRDEAAGRGVRAEPGLALRDRARRRLRLGGAAHRRLCGHLRVAPEGAQRPGPAGVRQPGQGGLDPACADGFAADGVGELAGLAIWWRLADRLPEDRCPGPGPGGPEVRGGRSPAARPPGRDGGPRRRLQAHVRGEPGLLRDLCRHGAHGIHRGVQPQLCRLCWRLL